MPDHPRVFISYSHDDETHRVRVLNFVQALRSHGIDADLDQFHGETIVHWPNWCRQQMAPEQSDFVICVCTAEYRRRIEGNVPPEQGKGVYWEGILMQSALYDAKGNRRFIPVLLDAESDSSIVEMLHGWTYCRISRFEMTDSGYELLYRILTGQMRVEKASLGPLVVLSAVRHAGSSPTTDVDHRTAQEVRAASDKFSLASVRAPVAGASVPALGKSLHLLHLSDLHFSADTDPVQMLQPLVADLTDRQGLKLEQLDYLVISGDCTCIGSAEEFDRVYQFLALLIDRFGLSAQRCVLVPGNHDLSWKEKVYDWKDASEVDTAKLPDGSFRRQGDGYLVRSADAVYGQRFKNFATFHHQFMQQPYPLEAEKQAQVYIHADDKIQFIGLNSSCRIDRYFKERASIDSAALSHALIEAERQIRDAKTGGRIPKSDDVLRIAVWHHPITGNEKVFDDAFVQRLQQADVQLCLHGHIQENRADLIGYTHPTRRMHAIGAGSFGAIAKDRLESTPRLYNLIEITADRSQVRVYTRQMPKNGGAWGPNSVWPDDQGGCRHWYDIKLRKG